MTAEVLRTARVFRDLPDEVLAALDADAETVTVAPGEVLIAEGDAADAAYVVVAGELEIVKATPSGDIRINVCGPGEPIGELALASGDPRSATVRALTPAELLRISISSFNRVLAQPRAVMALLSTMRDRLENEEAQLRQYAKMIALGRQTAGLLHELNNPAAAIQRNLDALGETLAVHTEQTAALSGLDTDSWEVLSSAAKTVAAATAPADALERADIEDELADWLDDHDVDWSGSDVAGLLAHAGAGTEMLDEIAEAVSDEHLGQALQWLAGELELIGLLEHSAVAAHRISEVVAAARSYVRLDEAPVGVVNIHEGIDSALTLLGHKAREGVAVERNYGEDVPTIEGYPADLNTVWTNLLDNALDAVRGKDGARIVITTRLDGDRVVVEVFDNGVGISDEHRERIFDPFFTTKGVGEGTGLGLSQSLAIVSQRHRGRLDVTSEPGETTFRVELPLEIGDIKPA